MDYELSQIAETASDTTTSVFGVIEKLRINDITDEYIDIYVPSDIISDNCIENIELDYNIQSLSDADIALLDIDNRFKNSQYNINIVFTDKYTADEKTVKTDNEEKQKIIEISGSIVSFYRYITIDRYNNLYKIAIKNKYFLEKGIDLNEYIIQSHTESQYDLSYYFDTSKENAEEHEFIILAEECPELYTATDGNLCINVYVELEKDTANINNKNISVALSLKNKLDNVLSNYTYKYNYPFEDDIQIEIISNKLYLYIPETYIENIFNRKLKNIYLKESDSKYSNIVKNIKVSLTNTNNNANIELNYDVKLNVLKNRFEIIFNNYTNPINKDDETTVACKLKNIDSLDFKIEIYDINSYEIDITKLKYNISLSIDNVNYGFTSADNNIIVRSDSNSTLIINILNTDFYNKCNVNLKDTIIQNSNDSNFNYHINNQFNYNGKIEDTLEIRYNDTLDALYNGSGLYDKDNGNISFKDINLIINNKYKFLSKITQQITIELCNLAEEPSGKTYNFQYINNKKDDIEYEISDDNILLCINGEIFERAFNVKLEHFSHIIPEKDFITLHTVTESKTYNETTPSPLFNPKTATSQTQTRSARSNVNTITPVSNKTYECKTVYTINTVKNRIEILCNIPNDVSFSSNQNISINCKIISKYDKIIYNDIKPSEYNYKINVYIDGKRYSITDPSDIDFSQDSNNSIILNINDDVLKEKCDGIDLSNYIHYDPYPNTNKVYDYFIDSEYFDGYKKQPSLEIRYDDISKLLVTGENIVNIYFTKLQTNIDDYIFNVNVKLKYLDSNNKVETNSFKFIKGQRDEVEFELNSTKTKLLLSIHESYFNKAFGFDLSDCIVKPIELKETNATGNSSAGSSSTSSIPDSSSTLIPSEISVNYGVQYNKFKNRIEILYNVADIHVIDNYDNKNDKTINAVVNCEVNNEKVKKLHTPANEFKYKVNIHLQSLDNIEYTVAQHTFTFDSKEFANNIIVSSDETNKPVLYVEGRVFNKIAQRDLSELVEVKLKNTTQNPNYNAFVNNSYIDANGELTDAIEIRYNIDTTALDLSVYNECDIYLQESKVLTKLKYNINIIEYKDKNCKKIYKQYSFVHIKGHRDEVEFEINNKNQVILSILNHNFTKVFDSSVDNYIVITNTANDVLGSSTLSPNTTTTSSPNTAITSSTTAAPFTYSSDVNIFKDRLEIVCPNINSIDEDKNGSVNITVHIVRKDFETYKYGESIFNYKYKVVVIDDKGIEYIFNYITNSNNGGIKLFEDDNSKGTLVITNDIFKKKTNKNLDDFIIVPNKEYTGYNVNYNLYANNKGEYENSLEIELNDTFEFDNNENPFIINLTNDSLNLDDYYYNIKVQEYDIFDNTLGNPYIFKYEKGVRDEIEFMQTLNGDVILVISNNNFKKMFGYDIDDYGVFDSNFSEFYEYDINKFKHQLEILIKDPKNKGIDNDGTNDKSLNLEVNVYRREDVDREKLPLETIDNYYTLKIYFNNIFIDGFTTNCIGNNKGSCFDLYYDENDNIEFKFDLCKAFNINFVNVSNNKELAIANIINISGSKIIKENITTELYKNTIGECIITGRFTSQTVHESINNIYLCLYDNVSESVIETHYIDLYIDGFYYDRLTNLKGFDLDYDTNKFTITNPKNNYSYVQTNDSEYVNIIDLTFGEYISGYFTIGNNYGKMYLKTKGQLTKYKMITIPNPLHKIPIIKFDSNKKNEEIIVNKPKPTTTSSTSTIKPVEPILPTPTPMITPTPIATVSTTTSSTCTPEPVTPTVTPDTTTSSSSTPKPTDIVTVTVSPEPVSPTVTPSVISKLYGYKIHSLGIERYNEYNTYNDALKAAKDYIDIYGQPSGSYPIYIYSPAYNRYDYVLTYTKASSTTTAQTTPQPIMITPLLTAQLYYNNGSKNYVINTYSLYSQNSNNTNISITKYTNGNYNYLCKLNAIIDNFSISNKRITNVILGEINITNYKFAGSIINIGLPKNYHGKTLYVYLEDYIDNGSSSTTSSSTETTTSQASTITTGTSSATSSNT